MQDFRLRVLGIPAPQGSKNAYVRAGRAILVEASKALPAWRSAVMEAARQELNSMEVGEPFTDPVLLDVTFYLERPKTTKHKRYPAGKPDLDHLIRAVGDSLTQAGVLKDDSLIVQIVARKIWCSTDPESYPSPGCSIFVTLR